jgi:hypothetical protein
MRIKSIHILLPFGFYVSGCFTPDPKSLNSENPSSAVPAIKQAADKNDRSAIPRLIADLDDNDSTIRFAAISALQQMTGQTYDYHYYADVSERKPAVAQWHKWLAEHPNGK